MLAEPEAPTNPAASAGASTVVLRRWPKPGPGLMAALFLSDSLARALLAPVIPLEALRHFGSERNASLMVAAAGVMGVIATFAIPALVQRWRPRRVYLGAIALLVIAPASMAVDGLFGFSAGWFLRSIAAASLLTLLNLYISAFIPKRQLASSEPLRTFVSGAAWVAGPWIGVRLYTIDPLLVFGISGAFALALFGFFLWLRLEAPIGIASRNPLKNLRRYFSQPRLALAWVINFGREMWWVTIFNYGPWYLEEQGFPKTAAGDLQCAGHVRVLPDRVGVRHEEAVADEGHAERRVQALQEDAACFGRAVTVAVTQQRDAVGARYAGAGLRHHQFHHPALDALAFFGPRRRIGLGHQHIAVGQHLQPARVIEPACKGIDG